MPSWVSDVDMMDLFLSFLIPQDDVDPTIDAVCLVSSCNSQGDFGDMFPVKLGTSRGAERGGELDANSFDQDCDILYQDMHRLQT